MLLILDKAPSHNNDQAIEKLYNNNIPFVFIPSGLTRFLQPLDISINKPFKDKLRNCHALWRANNPNNYNQKIKKEKIVNWINDIWNNNLLIKTETVFNSFKIVGITNSMDGSEDDYFV